MRVNIGNISNLNRNELKKLDKLKEGDVVRAKVIEVKDGVAKIDLGNGEIVEGKLDISSNLLEGKVIKFLIKDVKNNVLHMSPVYEDIDFSNDFVLKNESLIMDRILNLNNLSNDEKNLSIIENMIAFKMPLKPEDIEAISKYTDKIISLLNLSEGEEVQTPAANKALDEDISKLIKLSASEISAAEDGLEDAQVVKNTETPNQSDGKNVQVKNQDVNTEETQFVKLKSGEELENAFKNIESASQENESENNTQKNDSFKAISADFLNKQKFTLDEDQKSNIIKNSDTENNPKITEFKDILNDLETKESNIMEFKQITEQIKDEMKNIFSRSSSPEDIIQKLTFLVKSDIDVTINNLSRLTEFLESQQTLNKEMVEVLDLAVKEGIIDEKTKFELLDKTQNINLKFDGKDHEKLSKFYKEIEEVSVKLLSEISSSNKSSEELNVKAEKLNDSINFYNKINDKATMMLIPFTLNNKEIENSLYVLSRRKVSKKSDNIKVYMALDTNNLEKVKILCDFSYDRLNVNFKVREDHIPLFERGKKKLSKVLEEKGYENVFIYINKEEEENVLDLISYDDTINYMLNIKV